MPEVRKTRKPRPWGQAFPNSRYDDPRGGRPSALERNILRYRGVEVALYLYYAERVREFMLTSIYRYAVKAPRANIFEPTEERRLRGVLSRLLTDAAGSLSATDADALRLMLTGVERQSKKLKRALGYVVKVGMFTSEEAAELIRLLDYRNHIAHRIHLVMADVSRSYFTADRLAFTEPLYKHDALDRLRKYVRSLDARTRGKIVQIVSFDDLLFELAERVYEDELKRLNHLIQRQIKGERARPAAINSELDVSSTELIGDLDPRSPSNQHMDRHEGPASGHLTQRGVEICYRLFDIGKSSIAVAYLMGMSLRAAQNRRRGWLRAGGSDRTRAEIDPPEPSCC